jgi:WD40 repeat protein
VAADPDPSGATVLVGGPGGRAELVDAATGRTLHDLPEQGDIVAVAAGVHDVVTATAHHATLWTTAGRRLWQIPSRPAITAVAVDGRGNVAVGAARGSIRIYSASGAPVGALVRSRSRPEHLAFSPDGHRLVAALAKGRAWIWAVSGNVEHVLVGHTAAVLSARFSPDGTRVVTASLDHDARLFDADSGHGLSVLSKHSGAVNDAVISHDGKWVVTAGPSSVGLWSSDGRNVALLYGPPPTPGRWILTTWFSPRDRLIESVSQDGTLRAYRCVVCEPPAALQAEAERRLAIWRRHG